MKKLFSKIPRIEGARLRLCRIPMEDADALGALAASLAVYRYLPTFLIEKKSPDMERALRYMYGPCLRDRESIHLGIYLKGEDRFCGIAEMYGFKDRIHKISIGYRLMEDVWGQGLATEAVGLMVNYLYGETDIEIITASTMIENRASARVLIKNGFTLAVHAASEDWGYPDPTAADKWIR